MNVVEGILQLVRGGWPTFPCADCGIEVSGSGENIGAAEIDGDRVWRKPCAARLPD